MPPASTFPPPAPICVPAARRARFQLSAHWPFPCCLLVACAVNDAAGLFAPEGNTTPVCHRPFRLL